MYFTLAQIYNVLIKVIMQKAGRKNKAKNKQNASVRLMGSLPRVVSGTNNLNAKDSISRTWVIDLPITPQKFTVSVGTLATVVSVDRTLINAFTTKFQVVFQEYRILGAVFNIRQIAVYTNATGGAAGTGLTCFYLDEKSSAAPGASTAVEHPRIEIPQEPQTDSNKHTIKWKARDILDLEFTQVTQTVTPVYFKAYTDTTNFFASATDSNTSYAMTGALRFEFRGLV